VLASFVGLMGCTSSAILRTPLSAPECVLHAKQVLYDAEFTQNLVVAPETSSVSGQHGGYYASIHCEGLNQAIDVKVDGLDPIQADWYRTTIVKKF
jgi:hypothetical protein